MATRGWSLFVLYVYIENFKTLLIINQWTDFNITGQECFFGDPLPRLFKPPRFVKNMAARGWGLFFQYIYIENFKNLRVRNHCTEFSVTWQECCFGDLLPRLFKPSYVKKHGLFSLHIYIKNFKILLVRNHSTDFSITWQECCFGDSTKIVQTIMIH